MTIKTPSCTFIVPEFLSDYVPPVEQEENFYDDEDNFQTCDECDLPDACADFGCWLNREAELRLLEPEKYYL